MRCALACSRRATAPRATRRGRNMRKARAVATAKDSGAYVTAGCLSASLGYSSPKPSNLPSKLAVILWLPEEAPKASASLPSRVGHVLPAVQRVLMSTEASPPDAIFLLDCTPLVPAGQSARAIMDKESSAVGADGQLGKSISKPVSRILDRLCAGCRDSSITLVGVDGGAPLALALLQHHKGVGTISRVVLLRPHLSAAVVNALLVKPSTTAPPALDVLYASERDRQRRDAAVRHAFPTGDSRVLDSHVSVGKTLYAALLSRHDFHHLDFAHLEGARIEPEQVDAVGRSVWWNEWSFELNRHTKQPEAVVSDLDPADVARAAVPGSPASVVAAAPAAAPSPTAAPRPRPAPMGSSSGSGRSSCGGAAASSCGRSRNLRRGRGCGCRRWRCGRARRPPPARRARRSSCATSKRPRSSRCRTFRPPRCTSTVVGGTPSSIPSAAQPPPAVPWPDRARERRSHRRRGPVRLVHVAPRRHALNTTRVQSTRCGRSRAASPPRCVAA